MGKEICSALNWGIAKVEIEGQALHDGGRANGAGNIKRGKSGQGDGLNVSLITHETSAIRKPKQGQQLGKRKEKKRCVEFDTEESGRAISSRWEKGSEAKHQWKGWGGRLKPPPRKATRPTLYSPRS